MDNWVRRQYPLEAPDQQSKRHFRRDDFDEAEARQHFGGDHQHRLWMSRHPQPIPLVPEETARVARTAFPPGNVYLMRRDALGTFVPDDDVAGLFPTRGQPATAPWRLALVTLMPASD